MSLREIEERLNRLERAVRFIVRLLRFEEGQIQEIQDQLKPKSYPRSSGITVTKA